MVRHESATLTAVLMQQAELWVWFFVALLVVAVLIRLYGGRR